MPQIVAPSVALTQAALAAGAANGQQLRYNAETGLYGWSTPGMIATAQWHHVGGASGVGFQNSWGEYDGGFQFAPARYMIDAKGKVRLSGLVRAGGLAAPIFTLPVGFRPAYLVIKLTSCSPNGGLAEVRIDAYGNVYVESYWLSGTNAYVSLAGISFFPAAYEAANIFNYPTLGNSWANYGGGTGPIRFIEDADDIVHWGGLIAGGTLAQICSLPGLGSGTDDYEELYCLACNGGALRTDALANGIQAEAYTSGGNNTYLSMDGLAYIGLDQAVDWHTAVGTAYVNSWASYSTPTYPDARFCKDSAGIVYLSGLIKSGTATQCIQFLPNGFRPAYEEIYNVCANNVTARVDVTPQGSVNIAGYATGGSNVFLSLDGICFPAEG